jgi:LacI family transcriptional regulator
MSRRVAIALQIDEPYPHHQEVFAGIVRYAQERADWECLIDEHPASTARRRHGPAKRYDGVIARARPHLQRLLQRQGIPLVNTLFQTNRPGLPGVYADPWAMGRLAAEHLIDRAFRRLCVLVDRRHKHSWEICQGYVRQAAEANVSCTVHDLPEEPYDDPVYWLRVERSLIGVLEELTPPVAVFAETAPVARLMVQLARARKWRVPHDLAILCAHNLKAVVGVAPQISAIEPNYERVGYEAAGLLDRLMAGEAPPPEPIYVSPRGIMARESTDYSAVEDKVVAAALHFVSGRLGKPLRLGEIAAAVMVSPRSLQLRFRAGLGRSVSDEIRRLRIESAKRMLAEPDRQIREIAVLCGFRNSDIMGQVFRREVGSTPRQYRKQVRSR